MARGVALPVELLPGVGSVITMDTKMAAYSNMAAGPRGEERREEAREAMLDGM